MEETQILRVKAEAHQDTARYKSAALLAGVLSQTARSDRGDSSGPHPALLPDSTLMAWKEDGPTDKRLTAEGKEMLSHLREESHQYNTAAEYLIIKF